MCYDYAAIGTNNTYLWAITADATTTSPFGTINVDATAATLSDFSGVCSASSIISLDSMLEGASHDLLH